MNPKKKVNEKDKKQFKMISTTAPPMTTSINMTHPLYYVNEGDDLAYNEKRSAHNALERQRREGLNNKFQELAHVLPSLRQVTRPSKSLIVAKSLEFVSSAEERESDFQSQIQALKKENEQLMRQAQLSKKRKKKRVLSTSQPVPLGSPIASDIPRQSQRPTSQSLVDSSPIETQLGPNKKKRGREEEEEEESERPSKKQQQVLVQSAAAAAAAASLSPPPISIPSNIMQHNTNNLNDQLLLSTQHNNTNYMYINSIPATSTPISHTTQQLTNTTAASVNNNNRLNLVLDSFLNDDDLFQWH